jgi:predicted LPLAT superfamily acyltransferase
MGTQRGNGFGLYIVYLFFRFFGYIGLHLVLGFVVFYFVITTPTLKRYLRHYYLLCTGKFNFFIYYRHIYTFALVFSDRFLSKRFLSRYHIETHNAHVVNLEKGALFLFSHIGDWSMCGLVPTQKNVPINVVMHEAIKESIQEFAKSITDDSLPQMKVIDLSEGAIQIAIKIAKAFQNREIVAMMADRIVSQESGVDVHFLGRTVRINKNPFEVAYNRDVPMIALFSLRAKDYYYNSYYHALSPFEKTLSKEDSISQKAQEYATLLEHYVREHPDQWFNHYDFFGTETSTYEPAR